MRAVKEKGAHIFDEPWDPLFELRAVPNNRQRGEGINQSHGHSRVSIIQVLHAQIPKLTYPKNDTQVD